MINIEGITNGQTVYGIVKLKARVSGITTGVNFYLDTIGEDSVIGEGVYDGNSVYSTDWFTQETFNGMHTIYTITTYSDGTRSENSIDVKVINQTRADAIPSSVIKMTPANDNAPPQLSFKFKNIWNDPVPMDGPINTTGAEDSPFITPDGNTFYFWFNADETKDIEEQVADPLTGIWWSKRVNDQWQEPQRLYLQYFNEIGLDGAPMVRGNTLWFVSIRKGNYRDIDIWTAEMVGGRWVNWDNAGELLNKNYDVGELHVSADGSEIYYGSSRPGGKGQMDIWVTRKENGIWQEPENITQVDSTLNEGQPFLSEDGNELWFTRSTPGPEIWRTIKINGQWQEPELIVSNLSGEPTLDLSGNLYFVHLRWDDTLNRATEADIYVCYRK